MFRGSGICLRLADCPIAAVPAGAGQRILARAGAMARASTARRGPGSISIRSARGGCGMPTSIPMDARSPPLDPMSGPDQQMRFLPIDEVTSVAFATCPLSQKMVKCATVRCQDEHFQLAASHEHSFLSAGVYLRNCVA